MSDNLFEWHFTIRGPKDTEFDGGVYHGRILFPSDYPYRPPDIVFLTKNGRFELEKKICLTISSHHEETWRPSWSIRTVLVALIAFMPTKGDGAIASLDWSEEERRKLAVQSIAYKCDKCGSHNSTALRPEDENEKLSADDVPEELQLRDSSKKGDLNASSSGAASSSAPSSSNPLSSSSHLATPDASTPVARRPLSHLTGDNQETNDESGDLPHILEPDLGDAPTLPHTEPPREMPLYQPAPMSATGPAADSTQSVRVILRDQLDNVLSILVLLIFLLAVYKLFLYL